MVRTRQISQESCDYFSCFDLKVSEYLFFLKSKNTVSFYIKLQIYISNFMIFFHEIPRYEDFKFWGFFSKPKPV